MDKTDKLYSGFIVSALLFWNPLSFRLIYHDCWLRNNKLLLPSGCCRPGENKKKDIVPAIPEHGFFDRIFRIAFSGAGLGG
jgi:hypothetical protein